MVEETDRLKLWERNVDGFTYSSRDEFLREQVLIDFDLTEQQFKDVINALKRGEVGGIEDLRRDVDLARKQADPEAEEFVDPRGAAAPKSERVSNTKSSARGSVDKPGILRRLARDRPDLLDRIEAGELSPNAAAVEAGFRRPMKSIPVDSADSAVRALLKVFTRMSSTR